MTLAALLDNGLSSESTQSKALLSDAELNNLHLDTTLTTYKRGGFKLAYFGNMGKNWLFDSAIENLSSPEHVCAKQVFYW